MKQQILQIIHDYPRHYTRKIKQNSDILTFLNNRYPSISLVEQIYQYVHNYTPVKCKFGNIPKFNTFNKGYWKFCGSKKSCSCARLQHSKDISNWKKHNPDAEAARQLLAAETMMDKFGCKNPMHNKDVLAKYKNTNLKRYGVEFPFQSQDVQNLIKSINQQRYGVDYPLQASAIQEKVHTTLNAKYGPNYMKVPQKAAYIKYGMNPFAHDDIKHKLAKTMKSKYNVVNWNHINKSEEYLAVFENKDKFQEIAIGITTKQLASKLEVDVTTIHRLLNKFQLWDVIADPSVSNLEHEMAAFLTGLDIQYNSNTRKIIAPFELDFYLQDYNLAIEMNGDYWHSEFKRPNQNYHYNKWKMCNDQAIHLLQISESSWIADANKYKELIKSLLHLHTVTIGARKTCIKQITSKEARPFVDNYHLQNFVGGTSHFGAFYKGMLIAVMTFGYTRNKRFELKRFVTDNNASYPGMFSKMFKHAQKVLQFDKVVSFSDNRWFTGNVYAKTGFKHVKTLPPAYSYLYKGKLMHMQSFTKSRIARKFPEIADMINEDKISERRAMYELGIPRIYDCGKKEWVYKL